MNQRLAEQRIRTTCRELLASDTKASGRGLRRELRRRFGAVGRTARVFQIWREESAPPANASTDAELLQRVRAAEAAAEDYRARAERAEYREEAHQTHWAVEVDRLREQLRASPKYAAEIRALQDQVMRLFAELQAARAQLARQA